MIKTLVTTLILIVFFALAYITDIFAILSLKVVFYISFGLVITMLIVAVFILGIPKPKDDKDDKTND